MLLEREEPLAVARDRRRDPDGDGRADRAPAPGRLGRAREIEILRLLEEGLPNAQISRRLRRSVKTVSHQVSAILAKLGAATRQEAAHIARNKGLLDR